MKKFGKKLEKAVRTVRDQVIAEAERVAESPTGQRIERETERLGDQIERGAERIAEQVSHGAKVFEANNALHETRHQATKILEEIQSDCKIVDERLKEAQDLLELIEKQSSEDNLLILERGAVQAAIMLQRQSKTLEKKAQDERGHISNIPKLVNYDIDQTTLQGAQALSTIQECRSKIKKNLDEMPNIKETLTATYAQLKKSETREEDSKEAAEFGSKFTTLEMSFAASCSSSSTSTMSGSSTSAPTLLTSLTQQQQAQPRLNPSTGDTTTPTPSDRERLTVT